ncbi:endonuclease [Bifidobacterium sp. DSM 109958]|uniref:Endonuclease n=1 Tax=Bifidobacterium moraviense TaxID=2675323 RepID=A0A7Y0F3P9_9BIFI|nr:hypothetical protein [Bifidobacterium sp. DSM 109958]NMN01324.1 endonuclease [Bifidobacterium sp. DSM 109958]
MTGNPRQRNGWRRDPLSFANCRLVHRRCNRLKSDGTDAHARALLDREPQPPLTSLPFATLGL